MDPLDWLASKASRPLVSASNPLVLGLQRMSPQHAFFLWVPEIQARVFVLAWNAPNILRCFFCL